VAERRAPGVGVGIPLVGGDACAGDLQRGRYAAPFRHRVAFAATFGLLRRVNGSTSATALEADHAGVTASPARRLTPAGAIIPA
jgi:hypothetical protein